MLSLEIRRTRKYVGTYQHLDKWEEIGTFDEIGRRAIPSQDEEDAYDPTEPKAVEIFCLVKLASDDELRKLWIADKESPEDEGFSDWRDKQIERALLDTHTQRDCHHEHDCCGCVSHSAHEAECVTGDLWRVVVHSFRNY